MNFFKSAVAYADLIKLGHTLFALPFALSALCLAYLSGHSLSCSKIFWVILAFAGARASAMGFNRIVDRDVDALLHPFQASGRTRFSSFLSATRIGADTHQAGCCISQ